MKKIIISAGEASGDFYAGRLASEIRKKYRVKVIGFGGKRLRAAGAKVVLPLVDYAIVGFRQVLTRFFPILRIYHRALSVIKKEKPDALVVVDYPGFHLKLIKAAKKLGVKKVIYYITPQVWAWKKSRVRALKKYSDLAVVKFPFEKDFLRKNGVRAEYYGNPMAWHLLSGGQKRKKAGRKRTVGLFPGSRKGEVKEMTGIMLRAAEKISEKYPDTRFVIYRADTIEKRFLKNHIENTRLDIKIENRGPAAARPDFAVAKSGTTTLQLALLSVPHVIVYRMPAVDYFIARALVNLKYVGLPNLVAGSEITKEFIQGRAKPENIAGEMIKIIGCGNYRKKMKEGFSRIIKALYRKSTPSNIAAAVFGEIK